MHKFLLACLTLLLPQLLQAQNLFESFKPGTYYLADSRRVHYEGQLKVHSNELVVKDNQGKVTRFKPEEVYYIKLADRTRFLPSAGFLLSGKQINSSLVEVLDSGSVMLMRYEHVTTMAPMMGASGNMVSYGGRSAQSVYLLQLADASEPTALPSAGMASSKKFREALAPYVGARPDLVQLLADKRISTNNLADFIHALNTGQPFVTATAETSTF
ncbi:hypothetical protein [Hymenobacter crusticola]|uniref:DUF4369 domain-containing protein n=1 Tax=Hymenobacter crusticola TaxID=1770526 RepID=A0A243WE70_9BACT|nr:hypothetical protein [Hymenobacter crusticola]OUJ73986.1 hypothetical protein BXP70_09525 [Hymenobacter crusticola]